MISLLTILAGGQSLASGHARLDRGLRNRRRHELDDIAIEHTGNDVIRAQLFRRDDLRYGVGGGDLHLLVDLTRAAIVTLLDALGACLTSLRASVWLGPFSFRISNGASLKFI